MKKFTALAGVLLLSSSLITACGPDTDKNAANRAASPDKRSETYDTSRGGRVLDTRDGYSVNRTGRDTTTNRYGVRGAMPGSPHTTGNGFGFGHPDRDRLGVRDNIGPDNARRGGVLGGNVDRDRLGVRDNIGPDTGRGGLLGTGLGAGLGAGLLGNNRVDQDRLGVRDSIGPDRFGIGGGPGTAGIAGTGQGQNMRADRTLESRIEALPGVRNASVVVHGNTAYVAVDRGFDANRNNTGTAGTAGTRNNMIGFGNTTGGDTALNDDLRTQVTNTVKSAMPTITNVYVSSNPAVMDRLNNYTRGGGNGVIRGLNDIGDMFTRPFVGAGNTMGTGSTAGNTAGVGTTGAANMGTGAGAGGMSTSGMGMGTSSR